MAESFLRSKRWLEFQQSLGRPVFYYEKEGIKANIIGYDLPMGRNYLYIPSGPEVKFDLMIGGFDNPIRNFISHLKKIAADQKSIFIKIESTQDNVAKIFYKFGFRKGPKEIQPAKTVILDLRRDSEDILESMHHKTRYNIKVAQKHNISVVLNEDIESFWYLLKSTAKRDKFYSHTQDYYFKLFDFFRNDPEISVNLFLARESDRDIAGAIILKYKDTGYYLHGASDYNFRNLMAPFMLHWKVIEWLKESGCQSYDLWGIDSVKWPGVTRFKLGWGGEVIEYPGSFDLPVSRLWYFAYRLIRRVLK